MSETNYHFGWRPSELDRRDTLYAFSAKKSTLESLPASVDLSDDIGTTPWDPVWAQGSIGCCGPHSAAADIVFSAIRQDAFPSVPMPSRNFIYWCARREMRTIESDSGVDNRSMLKALNKYGWCDESLHPYSDKNTGSMSDPFRQQPSAEAFAQAATRKIIEYKSVPQVLEQMMACLAEGDPFIFGFSVYQSMLSKAVEKSGEVPMPKLLEAPIGGHDVLCCGYIMSTRRFIFRNSWGSGWGINGMGTIPMEYAVNPQLASDFWTVRHSAYGPKPPAPVPPSPPSPVPPAPVGGRIVQTIDLDRKHVDLKYPAGWTGTATKE